MDNLINFLYTLSKEKTVILMEKGKMVLMIFISIFTFILIISILALISINLQKEESIPREKQSYDLTEKEIESLTTFSLFSRTN